MNTNLNYYAQPNTINWSKPTMCKFEVDLGSNAKFDRVLNHNFSGYTINTIDDIVLPPRYGTYVDQTNILDNKSQLGVYFPLPYDEYAYTTMISDVSGFFSSAPFISLSVPNLSYLGDGIYFNFGENNYPKNITLEFYRSNGSLIDTLKISNDKLSGISYIPSIKEGIISSVTARFNDWTAFSQRASLVHISIVSNLEFTDEILYFDIDESLEKQRLDLVNFVNKKLRLSLIDKHGIFTNSGTYAGLTIDRLTNAKCKLTITQEGTVYADECDFGTWYIDEITYNSSNNNVDLLLQDSLHLYKSQVVEYNQYDLVDDKNKPFNALDTINYLNSTLPQSIPFGYMSYVTNPSIINYNDYSDVNTKEDFKKYVPDEKGNALYTIASASDNTRTIVQMIYNSVFLIPLSRFSPNYEGFQMNSNQITYDTVLGNAPNDNTPDEWYVHNSYIYEYCHDLTFGFKDGFASDYIEYPAKSLLPSHKNENSLPLSDLSYNEYQSNYALKYTFDDIKSNQNENIANKHRPLGRATYYTTDDNGIKTSFLDVYPYQSTKHIFNPKTETITITDWYRYDDYIGYAFNYTENYKTYKYITIQRNIRYNGSLTYTTTGAKIRNDNLKPNKK